MQDPLTRLSMMTRPRVLVDAAQIGATFYLRHRDLPRVIGEVPGHGAAMMLLFEAEADLDAARQAHEAYYRPARHVVTLSALMAEARLLRAVG